MEDEITIGPLTFTYDPTQSEIYVSKGEDHIGTIANVWPTDWDIFFHDATV